MSFYLLISVLIAGLPVPTTPSIKPKSRRVKAYQVIREGFACAQARIRHDHAGSRRSYPVSVASARLPPDPASTEIIGLAALLVATLLATLAFTLGWPREAIEAAAFFAEFLAPGSAWASI